MTDKNIFLSVCSWVVCVSTIIILICTFIPHLNFDNEIDDPHIVRAAMVIVILSTLQGIF